MKKQIRCIFLLKSMLDDTEMKKEIEHFFCIDKEKMEIVIDRENPEYVISDTGIYEKEANYTAFKKLYSKERIKILIVDEAQYPDLNLFDYVLMFMNSHLECDDRVSSLPVEFRYGMQVNELTGADDRILRDELGRKSGFCNFLYSNGNAHPMRDKMFYEISRYKAVDAIGKHLNNISGGVHRGMHETGMRIPYGKSHGINLR